MSSNTLKRVLIMAGGTGGHIFPGLAVAKYLRDQGVDVQWLGTPQGLEAKLIPEANIPLHFISISGLRGKSIKTLLSAPVKLCMAIFQAKRILKTLQPDVVLGMGGFVSGPGGIASWLLGYPLVIHEQNAKAGFTNKVLSHFSDKILQGFPSAFPSSKKVVLTGNPVRVEIENITPPAQRFQRTEKHCRLLIIGGSLGAQAFNEILPHALALMNVNERPEVMHQTGEKHWQAARKVYEAVNIQVDLVPFIKDMAAAYAWADIVLCRAGALTVAELCAAGVGAIFIPYPYAVDDHQTANAEYMVQHQAALCLQQKDLTAAQLAAIVSRFSQSPHTCHDMAYAAYQLRVAHTTEKIVDVLRSVIKN